MNRKLLITFLTLMVIIMAAGVAVFLTKGYTFSTKEGKIFGTGIISVTSLPDGASVYLDSHLTTATNANIPNLPPKKYQLKIIKEGFIPWEKEIEVKEGLVSEIKATLFPSLPTIYPLTFNGVAKPILSDDGTKLAYVVPGLGDGTKQKQKGGVWVWTMSNAPLSFSRSAEPHQITASTPIIDFDRAALRFSADAKQLLVTLQEGGREGSAAARNFLLPVDQFTQVADARDITPTVDSTLKGWQEDQKTQNSARVLAIMDLATRKIASDSAFIKWSPDETKFMVGEGLETVYDLSTGKKYDLPEAKAYYWLPDSKHIILIMEGKISVAEFDGSNAAVVFAGKFADSYVFPWPDSSRLVIVTSFDTPTGSQPNLFGVNLK